MPNPEKYDPGLAVLYSKWAESAKIAKIFANLQKFTKSLFDVIGLMGLNYNKNWSSKI